MNARMLMTLSWIAGIAALVGVILLVVALSTGGSLAAAAATTLIGVVLFFALRHVATKGDA